LWISSEDGPLMRYRDGGFLTFTTKHGLPQNRVEELGQTAHGELLVRTQKGWGRFRNERFEAVASDPLGFESTVGYRKGAGAASAVWYRENTELRRVSNGRQEVFQVPDGQHNQLYEDRQGRLWTGLGGKEGLSMLKDNSLRIYTAGDGLPPAPVEAFCEDHTGTLWFGTNGAGLVRFKDDKFATFTTGNGLSSNHIRAIFEDREGIIWLGTSDNGLMRMTPQLISAYSEKDGLAGKTFYPILEDHAGDIWIANAGVNRFRDGRFSYYPAKPPSLKWPEPFTTIRSMWEDSAGRILLGGGGGGLATFQNEKLSYDSEGMKRAPLAIYQDRQGAWLSYIKSEHVRFKYRLEGLDQNWVEADNRRVAYFSHLQAGSYTFRVIAANIAVLDMDIPAPDGLGVARLIREKQLPVEIVILTMHKTEAAFNLALDLGVKGYVLKDGAANEVISCIKAVAAGQSFISPELSGHLINRLGRAQQPSGVNLLTSAASCGCWPMPKPTRKLPKPFSSESAASSTIARTSAPNWD
jgi:streptogramin lyase